MDIKMTNVARLVGKVAELDNDRVAEQVLATVERRLQYDTVEAFAGAVLLSVADGMEIDLA
ncbi:hypothetical protein [Leucobacter aridicollis]|mgnify:CR=1 FL=1|uniref:hypothetical protein n=1 Tax=Leucobacter aridicollis TaxID=283878 RepID=UPI0021689CDD|nr:hypothetical protein [Leucobacter aridicollis]MCS3426703.1 hypothetical protein [Leucobacter aridicollis]